MSFPRNMLTALALWACLPIGQMILQAASPDLRSTVPRGGQIGTEVEVTISGARLQDAEEILFHETGVTWKNIVHPEKTTGANFKVTFVVAPDAHLGEHTFRVRTKSGLSFARRFWISQFPNHDEVAGNNEFETPQEVPLNVTLEAVTAREAADYFQIEAKKGQRISVEVEGLRANAGTNFTMDPYVAILNQERFELVASDDTALLKQDCFVSTIAPADGKYVIEVRDAAYQGSGRYRAHVGTFPRPTAIFPAGGQVGQDVEAKLIGDVRGELTHKFKAPAEADADFGVFVNHDGQIPPSPNAFRVVDYPNVMENEEANDSMGQFKDVPSSGNLPLAFNGILQAKTDAEGNPVMDYDYFKFTAKKGQKFRFRAHAKQINSPVDTVLHIFNAADSKTIGGADDADGSADARYDFTAPVDGDYFVRVYDMLKRGGEDFVYRIETETIDSALVVSMPEFATRNNQHLKQMEIPRGGRYAVVANVTRQSASVEAKFEVTGLPAGVKLDADLVPANVGQFPMVFEATADAPIAGTLGNLWASSTDPEKPLRGKYTQRLDYVRGTPNGTLYYWKDSDKLPIAVTEEAPYTINIEKPTVPLLQNGSIAIKIVATRKEGFTKPITVRWLWRPPGISCNSTATIPEGKNETVFNLTANASATVRTWKVVVQGECDAGTGIVRTASSLVDLEVAPPYVNFKINLATVHQGQPASVLIDVEKVRDFTGEATARLVGLPAKTVGQEIKFKPGQEQVSIPVTTEDGTPVGQHKNIFCELVFSEAGQELKQRAGMGGVFRVDPKPKVAPKPAPKPAVVAAADAKPAAPAPKPEKPLTRLEQLRLEAKQKAEAAKKGN
ncbi:MAG: hypothetical protein ACI8UO_003953 [Verrucomicrobiales bacterium]